MIAFAFLSVIALFQIIILKRHTVFGTFKAPELPSFNDPIGFLSNSQWMLSAFSFSETKCIHIPTKLDDFKLTCDGTNELKTHEGIEYGILGTFTNDQNVSIDV